MPLFEFHCEDHGTFEVLRNSLPKDGHCACPVCDVPAPFVWPLVNMKPDSLWAGHVIENHGYFTSESQLNKTMKKRKLTRVGDRSDMDGMKKMAEEAARARDNKFSQESKQFIRDEMGKRGLLDAEGNLKPEASKPLSDTPLISTKDDRLKV
jgi:hypothetical protein